MPMILKFFWSMWWMLFGAAIGVHWQFEGGYIALFAMVSLILADFFMFVVKALVAKFRGHY